jgi:hypothetical protein
VPHFCHPWHPSQACLCPEALCTLDQLVLLCAHSVQTDTLGLESKEATQGAPHIIGCLPCCCDDSNAWPLAHTFASCVLGVRSILALDQALKKIDRHLGPTTLAVNQLLIKQCAPLQPFVCSSTTLPVQRSESANLITAQAPQTAYGTTRPTLRTCRACRASRACQEPRTAAEQAASQSEL